MVLVFPSPELILLHDLTYPLPDMKGDAGVKTGGKATTGTFLGLNQFCVQVPPEPPHCTFKEHQQLSQHLAVHCEFALHPKSHKNKIQTSAAVRTKGYFLAHTGTTSWQEWSFPVLGSLPVSRCMSKQLATRRKIGVNQKSLHGLSVINRLEARAKSSRG